MAFMVYRLSRFDTVMVVLMRPKIKKEFAAALVLSCAGCVTGLGVYEGHSILICVVFCCFCVFLTGVHHQLPY